MEKLKASALLVALALVTGCADKGEIVLRSESGEPIAGIELRLVSQETGEVVTRTTDANGLVDVSDLTGPQEVMIADYASGPPKVIDTVGGDGLELKTGGPAEGQGHVEGYVRRAGAGVAGASVLVTVGEHAAEGVTSSDGYYLIPAPAGDGEIRVTPPEGQQAWQPAQEDPYPVEVPAGATVRVDLEY